MAVAQRYCACCDRSAGSLPERRASTLCRKHHASQQLQLNRTPYASWLPYGVHVVRHLPEAWEQRPLTTAAANGCVSWVGCRERVSRR